MRSFFVFLILIIALLPPSAAFAGGAVKVRAKVKGLSCPFCAYGIEKKINKIEGVKEVRVDIKKGSVIIIYKDSKFFTRESLNKALRDAGFTPGDIKVEDKGQ